MHSWLTEEGGDLDQLPGRPALLPGSPGVKQVPVKLVLAHAALMAGTEGTGSLKGTAQAVQHSKMLVVAQPATLLDGLPVTQLDSTAHVRQVGKHIEPARLVKPGAVLQAQVTVCPVRIDGMLAQGADEQSTVDVEQEH